MPEITVALASRNETHMLLVTVLSAVEAMKAACVDGEVFVVDNSDATEWAAVQDILAGQVKSKSVRLVHEPKISLAVAIDRAHREARGKYVFYTDAHTLIGANTIESLLSFPHWNDNVAFVHAPIQWAHRSDTTKRTHFGLHNTKLGDWAAGPVSRMQKIPWKGMPYMIRKDVYKAIGGMGCCAEHALGWGVLRYIGMKPWLLGYENWAIPDGVVYHFGEWPQSVRSLIKYRTYKKSGKQRAGIAYAVAAYVLGGEKFLREQYGPARLSRFCGGLEDAVSKAKEIGAKERKWILAHQKISLQALLAHPPWEHSKPDVGTPVQPSEPTITEEYRMLNAELHKDTSVQYGYNGAAQAPRVKELAKRHRCASILDYGAGKQTLSGALRSMGCNDVRDYDPAIPGLSEPPERADLVVCSDVLEHIEPDKLSATLKHLRDTTGKLLFARVCTVPCTSKTLPDGSDPHRSVHDRAWWVDELQVQFELLKSLEESDDRYFSVLLRPK